jgi:hypothetical protein
MKSLQISEDFSPIRTLALRGGLPFVDMGSRFPRSIPSGPTRRFRFDDGLEDLKMKIILRLIATRGQLSRINQFITKTTKFYQKSNPRV